MFKNRRNRKSRLAAAEKQEVILRNRLAAANAKTTDVKAAHQADHKNILNRMLTAYYETHAMVSSDFRTGVKPSSHMIGKLDGIATAIAAFTGVDLIVVGYKLENGTFSENNQDYVLIQNDELFIYRSGVVGPVDKVEDRLDRLHREALKSTGHPMYQVLYGDLETMV